MELRPGTVLQEGEYIGHMLYIFFALCPVAIIGWSIYQSDGEGKYRVYNTNIKAITVGLLFICTIIMAMHSEGNLLGELKANYEWEYEVWYDDEDLVFEYNDGIIKRIDGESHTFSSVMILYYIVFCLYLVSQVVITFKSRKTKGYIFYILMSIAAVGAMIGSYYLLIDEGYSYDVNTYREDIELLLWDNEGLIIALTPLVVSAAVFLLKSLIVKRRMMVK